MTQRQTILAMLTIVALVAALKLSQQLYRFVVERDERLEIARMEDEIEEAGYGIIITQLQADSLREVIDSLDAEIEQVRAELDEVERRLANGEGSNIVELSYRQRINAYNRRVRERNELYGRWRTIADSNSTYVRRYDALFDSIRTATTALGEPYYPIPTPAEIMARRRSAAQ